MSAESSLLMQTMQKIKQYALDLERKASDPGQCSVSGEGIRYALNRFYELFPGARSPEASRAKEGQLAQVAQRDEVAHPHINFCGREPDGHECATLDD